MLNVFAHIGMAVLLFCSRCGMAETRDLHRDNRCLQTKHGHCWFLVELASGADGILSMMNVTNGCRMVQPAKTGIITSNELLDSGFLYMNVGWLILLDYWVQLGTTKSMVDFVSGWWWRTNSCDCCRVIPCQSPSWHPLSFVVVLDCLGWNRPGTNSWFLLRTGMRMNGKCLQTWNCTPYNHHPNLANYQLLWYTSGPANINKVPSIDRWKGSVLVISPNLSDCHFLREIPSSM